MNSLRTSPIPAERHAPLDFQTDLSEMGPTHPQGNIGISSSRSHVHSKKNNSSSKRRPKRALSAFETYVRFELIGSATAPKMLVLILSGDNDENNSNNLSDSESAQHWKEWTTMPAWKKQVYENLAEADELRYKKELQVWQDSINSSPSKLGDFFTSRLYQKKATSSSTTSQQLTAMMPQVGLVEEI